MTYFAKTSHFVFNVSRVPYLQYISHILFSLSFLLLLRLMTGMKETEHCVLTNRFKRKKNLLLLVRFDSCGEQLWTTTERLQCPAEQRQNPGLFCPDLFCLSGPPCRWRHHGQLWPAAPPPPHPPQRTHNIWQGQLAINTWNLTPISEAVQAVGKTPTIYSETFTAVMFGKGSSEKCRAR